MPDIRMPDGTVIKNVPEGTTKEQIVARLQAYKPSADTTKEHDSIVETALRSAAQGATFGFADEISAGADALTQPLLGRGSKAPTLGARYDENLAAERGRDKADAEAHPVTDIAGNIAGAVAGPGKIIKGAKGAIGMIRQGAATGAIYGFGSGEGGLKNRVEDAAEGAAVGGATGAVFGAASKAYNKFRPQNVGANFVNNQFAKSPMTADSARISQQLGQTYTPGQATGSRSLLTIEGLVRRHPASADKMAEFDAQQLDRSLNNLVINLDRLHANPSGPEATGNLVSKAFDDVVSKAVKVRRTTASTDFGDVDKLVASERGRLSGEAAQKYDAEVSALTKAHNEALAARDASFQKQMKAGKAVTLPQVAPLKLPPVPVEAGKLGIVAPSKLSSEIDNIIETFGAPGGGDASAALVARAKALKATLPKDGGRLTANQTQRLLQIYGQAANGTGAIFKDLDTGQQRLIAGKLHRALMDDVDSAIDDGSNIGRIATALKTARDNYKTNSAAIDDLQDSVLGRLFGGDYKKAPERVAQAIKNMKPSELQQSMKILSSADPATSQSVKRYLVEDALNTAGVNPASGAPQAQIAGEAAFSAPKFLTAIRKSPVWNSFTPAERANMETAVRDLERVSFRAGTDGSPTAPLLFAWEVAKAMGGGALALSPVQIAKSVAAVMVPNKIAKAITTPQGQQALRTIRTTKPNSLAARAATSALVGMLVGDDETAPAQSQ